ncbi:MAG: spore cortex biosynthesis protein YabQ [Clostridia bacterium]|nr:spore cortex biosynthesis protein YabQ [Clostridia bacterium]
MTDYIYSLSLADQTKGFLLSLGFGFLMGIFYDLVRIVRISISKSKKVILVFDLLYFVFLGFCSYLFFLVVNEGDIRAFLLLGEGIGFSIYYFSLGVVVFTASEKILSITKKVISKILKIILFPFVWVFKKLKTLLEKFAKKWHKKGKKIKNKSKFHLKLHKHLLYNQGVKMVKNVVSQEKEV